MITYHREGTSRAAKASLSTNNFGSFTLREIESDEGWTKTGEGIDLTYSAATNRFYACYWKISTSWGAQIRFAWTTTSNYLTWSTSGGQESVCVANWASGFLSIDADWAGNPRISYQYVQGSHFNLRYIYTANTVNYADGWSLYDIDDNDYTDQYISSTIDKTGSVHISYYNFQGDKLQHAFQSWVPGTYDT
jgi:hypothetical protein